MSIPARRQPFCRQLSQLRALLRYVLRILFSSPTAAALPRILARALDAAMGNPYVADMIRFAIMGTIIEMARSTARESIEKMKDFFLVRATFMQGDFAYDWVNNYLEYHDLWGNSRDFRVLALDQERIRDLSHREHKSDGFPSPVYEPAPRSTEYFCWKGYWASIWKVPGRSIDYNLGEETGGSLTITMYTRKRQVLDKFVQEARQHYINNATKPPRKVEPSYDHSGGMLTAHFTAGDMSYNWIVSLLMSEQLIDNIPEVVITTQQYIAAWKTAEAGDHVRFLPPYGSRLFLNWRGYWIQVTLNSASVVLVLYNSQKSILIEFINSARQHHMETSRARVTLYTTDDFYTWNKSMTRSQRPLHTLCLPDGMKELLLADAHEFLESEEWYTLAGVPYRRGYLLHGPPGTGKSSTVHALAGELGLDVYLLSLAHPALNDMNLMSLLSVAPSKCIILIEDIDSAFPTRDDDTESEDGEGERTPRRQNPPRSWVTLAGLLNALDGLVSEEGRIVFATTNYIEALDPALIRPGRMDVKVQYNLATRDQLFQTFSRFYPTNGLAYARKPPKEGQQTAQASHAPTSTADEGVTTGIMSVSSAATLPPQPSLLPPRSTSSIEIVGGRSRREHHDLPTVVLDALGQEFAGKIPVDTYSIAQVQGFLLTRKNNPQGAVDDVAEWLEEQEKQRKHSKEARRQRRLEEQRQLEEEAAEVWHDAVEEIAAPVGCSTSVGTRPAAAAASACVVC